MPWRYSRWSADHPLPIGASERAALGQEVHAGDVLAAGTRYGAPVRVAGARRLGIPPDDLARVMRVRNAIGPSARMTVGRIQCCGVAHPTNGRRWKVTPKK